MTQERIDVLAKEFAEPFEPQFKKVAAYAYKQGLKKADELIGLLKEYMTAKDEFNEKWLTGKCDLHDCELSAFEMTRREDAIKAFIKAMEE